MPAGRPTNLTDETEKKICEALKLGNFRRTACEYAGVSFRSFTDWMNEGKKNPKSRAAKFRRAVIEAEKGAEILAVGRIMQAAQTDVEHYKWWITHRHRHWSLKTKVEHSGDARRPVKVDSTVDLRKLSDEELDKLEAIALRLQAGAEAK